MNSIDKTELNTEYALTLEELAGKLTSDSDEWILFWGSGASAGSDEDYRKVFSDLAGQVCEAASAVPATEKISQTAQKIRQAIQKNDFAELSDALFGDTWDGASFLDVERERNIKLRNAYAKQLLSRDEIDVYKANENLLLQELIRMFRGVILTTCQDDTVEAFWEYENSLPADPIVYTPQLIEDSNDWSRWLRATAQEAAYLKSQSEPTEDDTVLIKLFGSRDKPSRMLLSKRDMEEFYPSEAKQTVDNHTDSNNTNTICFLKKIFRSRNILFVGVDLENDWLLNAAEGILALLKEEPQAGVERYALLSKGLDVEGYHTQTINNVQEVSGAALKKIFAKMQSPHKASMGNKAAENSETAPLQSQKEILGLFWLFYNRRPQRLFLPEEKHDNPDSIYNIYTMEYDVLKRDIFGFEDSGAVSKEWNLKNIRQLAIAANNFSDFYDLRDAIELARTDEREPYETTIQSLLSSRLSKKGLFLYYTLQRYESGFPIGFLQLLPTEEYGLKSWRRAGIQLANSGIYVQRHGKQKLYERLSYADCVMRSAGRSLFQSRIRNEIDNISCQSMHSYFYPFYKVEIKNSEEIESEKIDDHFTKMLCTLYDILRDKGEEYQQIHALLQTELPAIVKMMCGLTDKDLKWKPGLLYYLLRESQVSVEETKLIGFCDSLQKECEKLERSNSEEPRWRLFSERLMLHQAKALIMIQSFEKQKEAADECEIVEQAICEEQEKQELWKGEAPRRIFEHRIHACFLRSAIFGRMSTIQEIERCKSNAPECREQKSLLDKMENSLNYAEKLIKEREHILGEQYKGLRSELARLMGEYYFKMSQYHAENRRFKKMDEWSKEVGCYEQSEKAYTDALDYYNRSLVRHWVQRADIMRNIGDMYCQWARSVSETLSESQAVNEDCDQSENDFYELTKKCYKNLINAYILYRSHSDLHGIADVLQSMGQAESYNKFKGNDVIAIGQAEDCNKSKANKQRCRTHLCYYKASADLYRHLGDVWSGRVASSFLEGCLAKANEDSNEVS